MILNDLACKGQVPEDCQEVSLLFTNDAEIHDLNLNYRGKDKPTDVLSFALTEEAGEQSFGLVPATTLGDLVISTETAERQAKKFRTTYDREIVRLIVHGLLHLCGYDHEGVPASEAQRMRREEQRLRKLVTELTVS